MSRRTFQKNPPATMSYSLPINLLRQHCFCPRIPYFQELLKLDPPRPTWVRQGLTLHSQQAKVFKHRTLQRFGLLQAKQTFNTFVSATNLQLHGIADSLLISDAAIYPIEFKLSGHKPSKGQIVQLTAYALVAEYQYSLPSKQGFMLFTNKGKTHPIAFTPQHHERVLTIRDQILNNLERGYLPDSAATPAQCTQCEYLNHCNDRG